MKLALIPISQKAKKEQLTNEVISLLEELLEEPEDPDNIIHIVFDNCDNGTDTPDTMDIRIG